MPGAARREIVAEGEVGVYHCMARCVRRAFLCGKDRLSGKDYSHRKEWVRSGLERLAGSFAIDISGFAIMDNHLHVIVRQRPDVAKRWSAEDVTRRWRMIFGTPPKTKQDRDRFETVVAVESQDAKLVKLRRARLSSVSWFMRCLCEPIARRANKEDGCTGRFWEGRFRSQVLLDDAAVLACSAYVDLNPIRAKVATTIETSKNTSIYERIAERQRPAKRSEVSRDNWLSPMASQSSRGTGVDRRASDDEFLTLNLDEYLSLLDWTGRQIRHEARHSAERTARKKEGRGSSLSIRGAIPQNLSPILDRLKIQPDGWLHVVTHFGRMFKHAAGSPAKLSAHAKSLGLSWLKGIGPSRASFL